MPSISNIAEQLKTLRQQRGWSQEDLACELGVCFSTVNRWENGKAKPSKLAQKSIQVLTKKTSIKLEGKKNARY